MKQYSPLLLLCIMSYQTYAAQHSLNREQNQTQPISSLQEAIAEGFSEAVAMQKQKQQELDQELINAVADGITATTICISSEMGTCVLGNMTEEFDAAKTASFIRITTALKAGASPNSIDKKGTPALFKILFRRHKFNKLSLLFEFAKTGKLNINMQNSSGDTAIDLTDHSLKMDHLNPTIRSIHRALIALGGKVKAAKETTTNTENKESENKTPQ